MSRGPGRARFTTQDLPGQRRPGRSVRSAPPEVLRRDKLQACFVPCYTHYEKPGKGRNNAETELAAHIRAKMRALTMANVVR